MKSKTNLYFQNIHTDVALIKCIFLLAVLICLKISFLCAQPAVNADEETVAHLNKFRSAYISSMLDKKPEIIALMTWEIT